MNEQFEFGYLIFDKIESVFLSRHGISFGWSYMERKAAILTEEQAQFWQQQLVKIKGRGGISVKRIPVNIKVGILAA